MNPKTRRAAAAVEFVIISAALFILINSFSLTSMFLMPWLSLLALPPFLLINVFPSSDRGCTRRLRVLGNGVVLLKLFLVTSVMSVIYAVIGMLTFMPAALPVFWINCAAVYVCESVVFWNGMIRIYITSWQLGLRWRVAGALCGLIPVVNLVVLFFMIYIAGKEYKTETSRFRLNSGRAGQRICGTRYPILLVHGVFFRDNRYVGYWGRIPYELTKNGAAVFYGTQQSAASIKSCGEELAARIKEIVRISGCGKVNVIAHSKGGLDMRYAITHCGAAPYVATLTTVNTPHRGCVFADYLLENVSRKFAGKVSESYNRTLRRLGDESPDFMTAVRNLTASYCAEFNKNVPDSPLVRYASVGSYMNRASNGRFPLNTVYHLVHHFDGQNDGLVAVDSMKWGSAFSLIKVNGERGVSHADVIDMGKENIDEFDVREYYVSLVGELKQAGF